MLTPLDEYPVHQTPQPVAHAGDGHPDFYDRYWFNGFRENLFFGIALGVYPNRDVIDAALSVVMDGVQRSVFASGRLPRDRASLRIGPISIEIVEPFRVNRVVVDAPEFDLGADLTYRARTGVIEEARQTRLSAARLIMDVTRATQFGSWSGSLSVAEGSIDIGADQTFGVKDRSWGIRHVGEPAPAAPSKEALQAFFLWAPLHFDDRVLHGLVFEDEHGHSWSETAAELPVIEREEETWGPQLRIETFKSFDHQVRWAEGLRRSDGATLGFERQSGEKETVELKPVLTFRMRGAGYGHPTRRHGTWIDELSVGGESFPVEELDNTDPANIHVQQVVKSSWKGRQGLGVLEQAVIGPHLPSGLTGMLDGARRGAVSSRWSPLAADPTSA
jgi:hypothetical protein